MSERDHLLHDLREGWREARRHRWFLISVAGHGVWHLGAGILLTLGPVIAVRSLGGESVWVVVAQAGTVATVLGVFAAPRLRIRRPLAVAAVGAAVYACPLAAFAFPAELPAPAVVVTAAYVIAMLGVGMLTPLWETVVQQRVEPQALGRVDSLDALISFAARPLGLAAAAPVAAWWRRGTTAHGGGAGGRGQPGRARPARGPAAYDGEGGAAHARLTSAAVARLPPRQPLRVLTPAGPHRPGSLLSA